MSVERASWSGRKIVTTANPERLTPQNNSRIGWRVYAGDAAAQAGFVGYSDKVAQVCIPMPTSTQYPIGSATDEAPVETNELWYHGATGSTIYFSEC